MKPALALFASPIVLASLASGGDKPDLIAIIADGLGYGKLGCDGPQVIHTPCDDQWIAHVSSPLSGRVVVDSCHSLPTGDSGGSRRR